MLSTGPDSMEQFNQIGEELTNLDTPYIADWYTGLMSKINRNGLNLLAVAFIAVGILLFVANFTNSPEMALLCVVVLLVVCVASLGLLVCVVVECLHAPDRCLFKKLDGLSAIIVAMFWFVYVFGEFTFGQNSPESALLCVVVLLVVCVASLGLLVCVVVECLHAPDRCLFKKLDGLSAIIVAITPPRWRCCAW
ncbi:uncharacterized protein LOC134676845 [Cydia fagiglandana]|uniref:uncharacterized protein LOC134676845 n=1 Tax=Cydia fagiglandana TaxID=1458189 RepID=UPI002FEE5564